MKGVQMNVSSLQSKAIMQKANRYCAYAIACLSAALLIFGVGPFAYKPVSVLGIVSLGIGVVFAISSYVLFARYARFSKEAENKQAEQSQ